MYPIFLIFCSYYIYAKNNKNEIYNKAQLQILIQIFFLAQGAPGGRGFPGADGSAGPKVSLKKSTVAVQYSISILLNSLDDIVFNCPGNHLLHNGAHQTFFNHA